MTLAQLYDSRVATVTGGGAWSHRIKKRFHSRFVVVEVSQRSAPSVKGVFLRDRHQFFRKGTNRFGFCQGGSDAAVFDQADSLIREQSVAMGLTAT